MRSESDIFLPRVICFALNKNTVMHFILFTCLGIARVPGKMNTENILSQQLLTPHVTWETCGNLWHLAESAHTHQHIHGLHIGGDISLTERYWDPEDYMHSGMHTHWGSEQSRTQPWKSTDPWGISLNGLFARAEQLHHLFITPSILPCIQGKKEVEPWFMSHEFTFHRDITLLILNSERN